MNKMKFKCDFGHSLPTKSCASCGPIFDKVLASTNLKKLERFYKRIANLTLNHSVIADTACVTADKLGDALETINPEWWRS